MQLHHSGVVKWVLMSSLRVSHVTWYVMVLLPLVCTQMPIARDDCRTVWRLWHLCWLLHFVVCYVWFSKEELGRVPTQEPLFDVPCVTTRPSRASVPTSSSVVWHTCVRQLSKVFVCERYWWNVVAVCCQMGTVILPTSHVVKQHLTAMVCSV